MGRHRFQQDQWLPISLEQAWDYFSNPANLAELTPPSMGMDLLSAPEDLHVGQILRHRVRALPGIFMTWVSEITAIDPGRGFVDEQRRGPFAFWRHQHVLEPENGGVRVRDVIDYSPGFWVFGDLANWIYVRGHLQRTFDFRRRVLAAKFGG
jgi:ligand-binding SRPBCC domain-containing protein